MPDDYFGSFLSNFAQAQEMQRQKSLDAADAAIKRQNFDLERNRQRIEEAHYQNLDTQFWSDYSLNFLKEAETERKNVVTEKETERRNRAQEAQRYAIAAFTEINKNYRAGQMTQFRYNQLNSQVKRYLGSAGVAVEDTDLLAKVYGGEEESADTPLLPPGVEGMLPGMPAPAGGVPPAAGAGVAGQPQMPTIAPSPSTADAAMQMAAGGGAGPAAPSAQVPGALDPGEAAQGAIQRSMQAMPNEPFRPIGQGQPGRSDPLLGIPPGLLEKGLPWPSQRIKTSKAQEDKAKAQAQHQQLENDYQAIINKYTNDIEKGKAKKIISEADYAAIKAKMAPEELREHIAYMKAHRQEAVANTARIEHETKRIDAETGIKSEQLKAIRATPGGYKQYLKDTRKGDADEKAYKDANTALLQATARYREGVRQVALMHQRAEQLQGEADLHNPHGGSSPNADKYEDARQKLIWLKSDIIAYYNGVTRDRDSMERAETDLAFWTQIRTDRMQALSPTGRVDTKTTGEARKGAEKAVQKASQAAKGTGQGKSAPKPGKPHTGQKAKFRYDPATGRLIEN